MNFASIDKQLLLQPNVLTLIYLFQFISQNLHFHLNSYYTRHVISFVIITIVISFLFSVSRPMSSLSCGQLHILRKLALLRLTACMERYCPSHKSGWNWELPKIIRKIKTPDYKGRLDVL